MKKVMKTVVGTIFAVFLLSSSALSLSFTDGAPVLSTQTVKTAEHAPLNVAAYRVTVLVSGFPQSVAPEPSAFYGEARDGSSYASVRAFASALGASASSGGEGRITVSAPGLELTASAGDKYIVANGRYLYAPHGVSLVDGEVYAPVRQMARAFGANAQWSDVFRTVLVTPGGTAIEPFDAAYSAEDLKWLSRIIYAEAGGESFEGMLAVGNVVMNRLRSEYYPNTIRDVVFDRRSGIQFTPAYSGAINNTPSESCVTAAKLALDGADVVGGSLYFASAKCWASRHRVHYATIGGHDFYL